MKKILIALLTVALCVSLVACGNNNEETVTTDVVAENITPTVDEASVGGQHWNKFVSEVTANPEIANDELAYNVLSLEINQFASGINPMPAGTEYFPGFDNFVITGYENATAFMPMMGSIAYVGYIFDLAEDADVAAFIKTLEDNCNPRWNICVEADQVVTGAIGNRVFFLMCPASYEIAE